MTAGSSALPGAVAWRTTSRLRELAVRVGGWWVALPEAARVASVFIGGLLLLVLRRPEAVLRPEFVIEDGAVFYIGTYFGSPLEILFRPYAGYQHFLPRVVASLERLAPVELAPLVGTLAALGLLAALVAFVASSRLSRVVPDARVRAGLAALLLVLPGARENIGVMADIQHFAPVYLLALSFASAPRGRVATALDLLVLAAVSLTGPYGPMLQPLFWWRAWRHRDRYSYALVAVLALGSVAQLASIVVDGRRPADLERPLYVVLLWLYRITAGGWVGSETAYDLALAGIPIWVGAVLVVLAAGAIGWVWRRGVPPGIAGPLFLVWAVISLGALLGQRDGTSLADPFVGVRYFVVPAGILAVGVLVAAWHAPERFVRWLAIGLLALFAIGVVRDFRLPPFPEQGWAVNSRCIGGPEPCTVPVWEPSVWTIEWPGSDGPWEQPRPGA